MLSSKLGLSALLMELSAWSGPLLLHGHSDVALASYLLLHIGASVLLALFIVPLLPQAASQSAEPEAKEPSHTAAAPPAKPAYRPAVLVLLALCGYAVPILGFIGVLVAVLVLRYHRPAQDKAPFESLQLPEFDQHQRLSGAFRQTGLGSFLGNRDVPLSSRMRAMVSLQHVSGRVSSPLLRNVLNDPSEDLRLLAYGMLDGLEQRISQSVDDELQALRLAQAREGTARPGPRTLKAVQRLSDLYWEFVYQDLAQGDLRDYAIAQSLHYCNQVLKMQPKNAPMWLRQGRLLHGLRRLDEAAQAYQKALHLGLPATRVLPYQAELSFERRDIVRAYLLMQQLDTANALPRLRPVVEYWKQG
jgi:polysaccharide biosynthesis protein PelE